MESLIAETALSLLGVTKSIGCLRILVILVGLSWRLRQRCSDDEQGAGGRGASGSWSQAIALVARQRYLSASIFVWQYAR
ncbi:hypothetical protein A9513_015100 [Pseudomonas sp. AU12215]|nr:hypothetical protein A9513_015100 [Pseudomonas sp. AU12215]